jgi:hypothetical protein
VALKRGNGKVRVYFHVIPSVVPLSLRNSPNDGSGDSFL